MYISSTLSASSLLRAHIRENVGLLFTPKKSAWFSLRQIQRYSYIVIAFLTFFSFHASTSYATVEEREFIVTAYYSPLPDQSFYMKGNFEAEKRLNGHGTHGASGKGVFPGMIAAPKSYAFGTKIEFDGLGLGIVEDRGGAIVEAGERGSALDRIDIWMGSGEEGLRRAMIWGKRKVKGRIVTTSTMNVIDFHGIDTGRIDLSRYPIVKESSTVIFSGGLSKTVLDMFADLGYTLDGRSEKDMLIEYQLDHRIITSRTDKGAGIYGPRTQASLKTSHAQYLILKNAELQKIEAEKALLVSEKNAWEAQYKQANIKIASFGSPKRGERGVHVRELQKTLKKNGYFKGKDTGVMNGATILAIKSLQRDHGIIASGTLDERTREVLIEKMITQK